MGNCKKLKTGNKTKIYVTSDPNAETVTWKQVKGATGFTPPDQGRDTVESEGLEQEDDIALRSAAGRQGGEITFGIEVLVGEDGDEENEGQDIIAAALESGDCIGVKAEIGGNSADVMTMMSGIVTQHAMQEITRTDRITYAATIACNALYGPEEDDSEGA